MDDEQDMNQADNDDFSDWANADINDVAEGMLDHCPRRAWHSLDDHIRTDFNFIF